MPYIYIVKNTINSKVYIGKTIKTPEERFKEHCYTANNIYKNCSYQSRLYNAMNKYGSNNFFVQTLCECSEAQLDENERYYISELKSTDDNYGYNIAPGGNGGPLYKGHTHSEQSRKLMSIKGLSKHMHHYTNGIINLQINECDEVPEGFYRGRIRTQQTINKYKDTIKNKIKDETYYERFREAARRSHETRRKNGTNIVSQDTCAKISSGIKQYYQTHPEAKEELKNKCKGNIVINNGEVQKSIKRDDLKFYQDKGFEIGILPKNKHKPKKETIEKRATSLKQTYETRFNNLLNEIGEDNFKYNYLERKLSREELQELYNISSWMLDKVIKAFGASRRVNKR